MTKLTADTEVIAHDLDNNWAVLAEAIQTVMRSYGIAKPLRKAKKINPWPTY